MAGSVKWTVLLTEELPLSEALTINLVDSVAKNAF